MACLKCGRESDQTFCAACREEMEKYPVKPGTIILLPKNRTKKRTSGRRAANIIERRLAQQEHMIQALAITVLCMALVIIGLIAGIFYTTRKEETRPVGQNYSTVTRQADAVPETTVDGAQ